MLSSTKRGANILQSFGWESVRRARNRFGDLEKTAEKCCLANSASLSDIPITAMSRDQQQTSFVIAHDSELTSFMCRPSRSKFFSSQTSAAQMTDVHTTWPRSHLPNVIEGLNDGGDHPDSFSSTGNDTAISVPEEMCVKLSFGSAARSCSPVVNKWDLSDSNGHNSKPCCKSADFDYCANSVDILQSTASAQGSGPSSVCTTDRYELSSRHITEQESDNQSPAVCRTQSYSGFPVRSSFTLPHLLHDESVGQEQEVEQRIPAKHPVSVQDLSGYLKLRNLHPPTVADVPSYLMHHYPPCLNDTETYKTKSLDFRVSRLRFEAVFIVSFPKSLCES
jgi:hypothetical protein